MEGPSLVRHLDAGIPGTPSPRATSHAAQPPRRHPHRGRAATLAVEDHRPTQLPHSPLSARRLELGDTAPPPHDRIPLPSAPTGRRPPAQPPALAAFEWGPPFAVGVGSAAGGNTPREKASAVNAPALRVGSRPAVPGPEAEVLNHSRSGWPPGYACALLSKLSAPAPRGTPGPLLDVSAPLWTQRPSRSLT